MSEPRAPSPREWEAVATRTATDRMQTFSWLAFNAYGIGVAGSGIVVLLILTFLDPPRVDAGFVAFLILLSATVRQLGFPIGGLTNSLFGIVDLTTVLLYGPVAGAWQASLAVLLHAGLKAVFSSRRTIWTAFKLPLFNASLKAFMALLAGSLYHSLGGPVPVHQLDADLILPGLVLVLAWFGLDVGGWSLLEFFSGGRQRLLLWARETILSSVLVELVPLPIAFLSAIVATTLGHPGFVLFALALVLASLAVRLVAESRRRLEARVAELTALNRVSEEIIRASRSETEVCEIVYRFARQVVDTSYFLLGILNEREQTETLAVLVADGERQSPRTLEVGGVVNWLREHRRPLLIGDLRRETLPFPSRQVGKNAHLVRSALFVPMLAGQELIGFMSIQSQEPNAFTPDDTRILAAMANQAAMALANIRLQRQAEEQERLQREVKLASEIQRSLLPRQNPTVANYDIASDWRSAREVSGDFYDFLTLPNGKLGIVIGDVADKGVPAALFMALSRSLVRSGVLGAASPAEGLRRANRWIIKDTTSDMFLTLFYAVLDPTSHTLTYVNAGHNPPLLFRHNDGTCRALDEHGMALGVVEETDFQEHSITLGAGDMLLCYTDGVTEAVDAAGEPFGEERLRAVAREHCSRSAQEIIAQINQALTAFIGDQPAHDDATLLVVRRLA